MEAQILRLELNGLTEPEFESELLKVWADLQLEIKSDPQLAQRLEKNGVPPAAVTGKPITDLIQVERGAAGLTGLETVLINLTSGIALKLFEKFILPQLRLGKEREAIQPSKEPN